MTTFQHVLVRAKINGKGPFNFILDTGAPALLRLDVAREGECLVDMIKEDLIAERIAIDSYREIAAYFAPFDSTTRRLLEEIQAVEEEHADDLAELLDQFPSVRAAKT